jgi:hypothetical protein
VEPVTGEIPKTTSNAYCARCIEGIGTALLFDESKRDGWFLLNLDEAVLKPWKAMRCGVIGAYIKVGGEPNICLEDYGLDWI